MRALKCKHAADVADENNGALKRCFLFRFSIQCLCAPKCEMFTFLKWLLIEVVFPTGHDTCVEVLLELEIFHKAEGNAFSPLHCAV